METEILLFQEPYKPETGETNRNTEEDMEP